MGSLLGGPSPSAAGEEPIILSWEAPADCPSQGEVRQRIDERLGGSPSEGRHLRASALVTHVDDGPYRVLLRTDLDGIEGERRLEADSCGALADAAALVIALTFDPEAVAAASERAEPLPTPGPEPSPAPLPTPGPEPSPAPLPTPGPEPSPAPVPEPSPAPVPEPTSAPRPPPAGEPSDEPRAWRIAGHAALDFTLGALPKLGIGIGGGLSVIVSRAHLSLGGAFYPRRRATLEGGTSGGDVSLALGSVWGGFVALREPLSIVPGVGLEIGVMSAEGFGVPRPDAGAGLWLTPFVSGLGVVPLVGPLGLRFEIAVGIPVFRPPFVLQGLGEVHRAAPVVGRLAVGPELRF